MFQHIFPVLQGDFVAVVPVGDQRAFGFDGPLQPFYRRRVRHKPDPVPRPLEPDIDRRFLVPYETPQDIYHFCILIDHYGKYRAEVRAGLFHQVEPVEFRALESPLVGQEPLRPVFLQPRQ